MCSLRSVVRTVVSDGIHKFIKFKTQFPDFLKIIDDV